MFSIKPKIIIRGVAKRLSSFLDTQGISLLVAVHTIAPTNKKYYDGIFYIAFLINSKLLDWFHKNTFYTARIPRGSLRYPISFLKKLPIIEEPQLKRQSCAFLAEYLLFLNYTNKRRTQLKGVIEFFDCQIADSLVYELYFCEKFHEDGLYPEPKAHLAELVSKHLKPISYDRWAELYWKKQLEENLTPEEEKELEELETENTKTIESVHNAITNDSEIQQQIVKIRTHEWIKIIEGDDGA